MADLQLKELNEEEQHSLLDDGGGGVRELLQGMDDQGLKVPQIVLEG